MSSLAGVEDDEYTQGWKARQQQAWAEITRRRKLRICGRCNKEGVAVYNLGICLKGGEEIVGRKKWQGDIWFS